MAEREKKTATKGSKKPAELSGNVPEWANTTAIAKLLGKTVRRIQQLTQEGILETEIPPAGGARKYKTCQTIQKYMDYLEAKAQETGENSRTAELNLKKLEAEVKLKESQGQLHQLKTAIAEGKYIPTEQSTQDLIEFLGTFKKFAMNIPVRTAGVLAGEVDAIQVRNIEKALKKELTAMLEAFAEAATDEEAL